MTAFFIATKLRLTMSHNDTIVARATPPDAVAWVSCVSLV